MPKLGTIDSTKAEVEAFYDFWYNFDSWRTFEWHDKEVNEGSNRFVSVHSGIVKCSHCRSTQP